MKIVSSPREKICSRCMVVNHILATRALKTSVMAGTIFFSHVINATNSTAKDVSQMIDVITARDFTARRVWL